MYKLDSGGDHHLYNCQLDSLFKHNEPILVVGGLCGLTSWLTQVMPSSAQIWCLLWNEQLSTQTL